MGRASPKEKVSTKIKCSIKKKKEKKIEGTQEKHFPSMTLYILTPLSSSDDRIKRKVFVCVSL